MQMPFGKRQKTKARKSCWVPSINFAKSQIMQKLSVVGGNHRAAVCSKNRSKSTSYSNECFRIQLKIRELFTPFKF